MLQSVLEIFYIFQLSNSSQNRYFEENEAGAHLKQLHPGDLGFASEAKQTKTQQEEASGENLSTFTHGKHSPVDGAERRFQITGCSGARSEQQRVVGVDASESLRSKPTSRRRSVESCRVER